MAPNKNTHTLKNLSTYIRDKLGKPASIHRDRFVVPVEYMYIRKLIPAVLDLYVVNYTCWSTHFRKAVRDHNLLHHIDPTVPQPVPDDIISNTTTAVEFGEHDAVVLSWIYVTISPFVLVRSNVLNSCTTAMDAWKRVRDFCQEYETAVQKKKRRFIHIDLNEDDDNHDRVDSISNLPDELIIHVLSLTNDLKTVVRTSILSKRWARLWTHLVDLDFNFSEMCSTMRYTDYPQPEMDKFVDWVNRVTEANQAPYLGIFRIHFALHCCYAADIDNWLKFAFGKEVRSLDLDFGRRRSAHPSINIFKIFPTVNPFLILNTTLECVHLKYVSINQSMLQWILTNCLNLQRLSLDCCVASTDKAAYSKYHGKLEIASLKLKHLEFFYSLQALNIDTLHLSAPQLASFICYEYKIVVEYYSVPSLVDVTLGASYCHYLVTLSGISSQLKQLSVARNMSFYDSGISCPTFINVLQLEIVYYQDVNLLSTTSSVIEACPLMHTFKLKLMGRNQPEGLGGKLLDRSQLGWQSQILEPDNAQLNAIRSHQHLKVVEYLGYAGCAAAAELALCLTLHAPMLQKFIFDTRQPQYKGKPLRVYTSDYRDEMEIKVRRTTKLLAEQIRRQGLDVVID